LTGATSNWTETDTHELQFANLAPGSYRLEVDAQDSEGAWSGHVAAFPFTILTPWYLRLWFVSLCVSLALLAVAGVFILRFRGAERNERELRKQVEQKTADLKRVNAELLLLSSTDALTGLANRRTFDKALGWECARVTRSNSEGSLLIIDVDHFKALNDSQGHQKGDECLTALGAELMRLCRRKLDLAARCGGEEFAMILPLTKSADAERVAETVRQAIADLNMPHPASPSAPYLTVSVGVATATRDRCNTPEDLLAAADKALYAAKRSGRNCVCVAQPDVAEPDPAVPSTLDPA
jgi:diguanylate cyclase (GGDEF)-like protein